MHGKLLSARMRKFGINFIATFLFSFFRVSTKIFCSHKDIITEETVIPLSHDFFFFLFRAVPGAYANSQARDRLGAADAGLCHSHSHSHARSELNL